MKRARAVTGALLLVAAAGAAQAATETPAPGRDNPAGMAPTFGKTLPPVGFVKFCGRRPEACATRPAAALRPHLSARQWELVNRVNGYVNADIRPAGDADIYGEAEHWDYPDLRGDCEDYALLKQRYLEALGLPRSALLLTVVLDDLQGGHAVLTLATSEGDFILDNRRDAIRRWSESGYTFLKRQSPRDPRDWLSLAPETGSGDGALASRADR